MNPIPQNDIPRRPLSDVGVIGAGGGVEPAASAASNDALVTEATSTFNDATMIEAADVPEDFFRRTITLALGDNSRAKHWTNANVTFLDLANKLTTHVAGAKDGAAFIQGSLAGGAGGHRRTKSAVTTLHVVGLDVENGAKMQAAVDRATELGAMAFFYSTHSHLSPVTKISQAKFISWCGKNGLEARDDNEDALRRYVAEVRFFTSELAATLTYTKTEHTSEGVTIFVAHDPMDRFRVIFPLASPFVVMTHGKDAPKLWARKVLGLASLLDLAPDESCLDVSRLFYFPRHPRGDTRFRAVVVLGAPLDLTAVPEKSSERKRGGTPGNPFADAAADLSGGERIKSPGGQDLKLWAAKHADGFQLADVIEEYCPERIRNHVDGGKVEVECPFDGEHSNPGSDTDQACCAINAASENNEGGFSWFCRHNSCTGRDRLAFLCEAIKEDWFPESALTDSRFDVLDRGDPEASHEEEFEFKDVGKLVKAINQRLAMVSANGGLLFAYTHDDGEVSFYSQADARAKLAPYQLLRDDESPLPGFPLWLKSPDRKEFRRIVFDPSGAHATNELNLWTGFATLPCEGDCSLFLAHIRDVICQGDGDSYAFILDWLRNLFQEPGNKQGTALVLRGEKGAGKSMFAKWLNAIIGKRHVATIDKADQVTGRFNGALENKLLITLEEALWAGSKEGEGALKHLTTGDTLRIERKGQETFEVANHTHVIILANAAWVVPASANERRFLVADVSDARRNDLRYWEALEAQFHAGGPAALLHYLLSTEPLGVDLRRPPKTSGLAKQVGESADPFQRWWRSVLDSGTFGEEEGAGAIDDPKGVLRAEVFQHFRDTMHGGLRRGVADQEIGRFLHSEIPALKIFQPHGQARRYTFPPLARLRAAFTDKYGIGFDDDNGVAPTPDAFALAASAVMRDAAEATR